VPTCALSLPLSLCSGRPVHFYDFKQIQIKTLIQKKVTPFGSVHSLLSLATPPV
jgi:hypothetical protein